MFPNKVSQFLVAIASLGWLALASTVAQAGVLSSSINNQIDGLSIMTPTFGQSFKADASHSILENFTFSIGNSLLDEPFTLDAYLFAWQQPLTGPGGQAIGSALFSQTITGNFFGGFQPLTINTGGVQLTPGVSYIMFLTVIHQVNVPLPPINAVSLAANNSHDPNNGGGGFQFNNTLNFTDLTNAPWSVATEPVHQMDLAFVANFRNVTPRDATVVPEPASLSVFGLLSMIGLARRRLR